MAWICFFTGPQERFSMFRLLWLCFPFCNLFSFSSLFPFPSQTWFLIFFLLSSYSHIFILSPLRHAQKIKSYGLNQHILPFFSVPILSPVIYPTQMMSCSRNFYLRVAYVRFKIAFDYMNYNLLMSRLEHLCFRFSLWWCSYCCISACQFSYFHECKGS